MLEYIKNIRQLKWDTNDLIHDTINDLSDESDYLIKLIQDKKLYDELHPWIRDDITRVEDDMDSVVNYVANFYMI